MTSPVPVRLQRIVLVFLLFSVGSLAIVNWRVLASPPDPLSTFKIATAPTPMRPSVDPAPNPRTAAPAQVSEHASILERPLFDASRRPPPPPLVKAAAPTPPPPLAKFPSDKFRLVGTMRTPGGPPQALIRATANDQGLWIAQGALMAGWRVDRVEEDRVDFSTGAATGTLKLVAVQAPPEPPNAAAPTPTPTQPPAPANVTPSTAIKK